MNRGSTNSRVVPSAEMRQTRDQRRRSLPNPVDHRPDISAGPVEVLFPSRSDFMDILDCLIAITAHLIEQRHVAPEPFTNELLMITSHGDHKIRFLDHLAAQPPLNMSRGVRAFHAQPGLYPVVDGLGLGFNSGRADSVEIGSPEHRLERMLRRQTPEDIPRADKQYRLNRLVKMAHHRASCSLI